ncbi:MAG: clan AA aspartic protease [Microcoleus sp. PH2017_29_MFU_D_A]|jgi:clan AA aspartic protease|uniref:clan AA aspartic protease n=1 Tax=unclassified Microcoleus TaxID=2642155 RepID=UPI001D75E398|nr:MULTISPECIES: clan AA aspartic protease [unclassified Microcoleus]MCC3419073.1 clan AA aspartic protease [Microcoleus sp. PH2017_07_MST_O_A]MCC3429212.1 clan AA aspartic protease [Microcoleus sp. PH2017_04_SCI_O_A]MCC3445597.1 clan AA aspartic protease [Microcoleus sp. PH2017_03_ELD_O_A]MCC3505111.1 clan AA aspartic protease [Microcoleus sp. PH2017_19_SFW_U_A]MCC3509658.1 clan AA aspartic protease [Microcoleus sp. PH2017_17_BER_D_A]TAE10533.1 MAG: clan AA aspartic protease [Oscillatoriales
MITGVVNGDYEPILRISIYSNNGELYERDAVVDTGFNGWLSLPPDLVVILGLPWQRRGRAILADGSESIFDIYEATILWDSQPVTIPIDEADSDPLIGMSLMDGYELTIQIVDSGIVTLKKI